MKNKLVFAAFLAFFALAVSAPGGVQATQWLFNLENRSTANVTTFRTQENGTWSGNWLDEIIAPGETFEMDFGTNEGDCTVRTRIEFTDGTYVDTDIDYCNMTTITVRNKDVVWN